MTTRLFNRHQVGYAVDHLARGVIDRQRDVLAVGPEDRQVFLGGKKVPPALGTAPALFFQKMFQGVGVSE